MLLFIGDIVTKIFQLLPMETKSIPS